LERGGRWDTLYGVRRRDITTATQLTMAGIRLLMGGRGRILDHAEPEKGDLPGRLDP